MPASSAGHAVRALEHLKRAGSSQLPGSPAELSETVWRCLGGTLGGISANRTSAQHDSHQMKLYKTT